LKNNILDPPQGAYIHLSLRKLYVIEKRLEKGSEAPRRQAR